MTTLCVFITSHYVSTFWYSDLHILNQSWFRVNHRWISAAQRYSPMKTQCYRAKKTALNSDVSELIFFETAPTSADFRHILWISAEKRQKSELALFSVHYLLDFNPGWRNMEISYAVPMYVDNFFKEAWKFQAPCVKKMTHATTEHSCDVENFVEKHYFRKI